MEPKTEVIKIYSENNEFQHAEALKRNRVKRNKNKKIFVEGVKSINLAIENHWEIDTFLYSTEKKLSSWAIDLLNKSIAKKHIEMSLSLMAKLSDKEDTSELIALIKMKPDALDRIAIKKNLLIVVIDRATSPGNLGTILRSCDSFKVDAVIMTGHSCDLYEPKTIQASIGTIFSVPIIRLESHHELLAWIEKIKPAVPSLKIIGTTVKTNITIDSAELKPPLLLLIGNETHGLSGAYKEICDQLVKIPIGGATSSLNVACATSIFLFEINRRN